MQKRSSIPLPLKFFGIGAPLRLIGMAAGMLLALTGGLLNFVGAIGGSFFNGLGNFLGTAGHLIGLLANMIATAGRSNIQFIDAFKAAIPTL